MSKKRKKKKPKGRWAVHCHTKPCPEARKWSAKNLALRLVCTIDVKNIGYFNSSVSYVHFRQVLLHCHTVRHSSEKSNIQSVLYETKPR